MSQFAEAMARGVALNYTRLGDPARFVYQDETVTDCTVIVDRDLSRYGDAIEVNSESIVFSVRFSDIPNLARRGDKLVLQETSEEFVVSQVISSDEFEQRVLAS